MLEYPQFIYLIIIDRVLYFCNKKRMLEIVATNCDKEEILFIQRYNRLKNTNAYRQIRERDSRSKLDYSLSILEPTEGGTFAQIDTISLTKKERWTQEGEDELLDSYCQQCNEINPDIELAQSVFQSLNPDDQ